MKLFRERSVRIPKMSEHDEQSVFFDWIAWQSKFTLELKYMYAIPNGAKLPYKKTRSGKRFSKEAIWLLQEGLKPGVPDTCLPVARHGYHGLYIEFKYGRNKPTPEQIQFLQYLSDAGYYVQICFSFEEAKKHIIWYMDIKEQD